MTIENSRMDGTLKVQGLGMDARKEAVFRMAFRMHGRNRYVLLDPGEDIPPQIAIADLDTPEGLTAAEAFRRANPQIPLLATSVSPERFPGFAILRKPIRMESLFPALETVLAQKTVVAGTAQKLENRAGPMHPANSGTETRQPPQVASGIRPPDPDVVPSSRATPAEDSPPPPPARAPVQWRPESIIHFDPDTGLLGLLQRILRDRIAAVITDARNGQILWNIDPEENRAQTPLSDEEIRTICRREIHGLQVRAAQSADSFPSDGSLRNTTLQELVWQAAAWTANGRLSRKILANVPVQLHQWPNLTRLAPLPESLRMAAFLARSPASPALTVKILQVQPAELFNFLAAAESLGLLRYISVPAAHSSSPGAAPAPSVDGPSPADEMASPALAKRGLLGRLFAKIAGL